MRSADDASTYYLVIARDTDLNGVPRCVKCGRVANHVHEIIPRSRFGKHNRSGLFELKNRCCVCRECHESVHNPRGRGELLHIMSSKHGYEYDGEAQCYLEEYLEDQW